MNAPAPRAAMSLEGLTYCTPPTVSLLGIGGCGINLVRKILRQPIHSASPQGTIYDLITFTNNLDTSRANITDGEKVSIIASGNGSGKVRGTHAEDISRTVVQFTEPTVGDSDVVILIMGMSGGK